MSYRSIKRALGETSLERKCRFLFGTCLLILIIASFWSYGILTERVVYEQNQIRGQLLVDRIMLIRHWEKLENMSPKVSENIRYEMEKVLEIMKNITNNLSKQTFEVSFIWANSTDNTNKPGNPYEKNLLEKYKKSQPGSAADSDLAEFDEGPPENGKYIYYQAIRADASCLLACHQAPLGGSGVDLKVQDWR